MHNSSIWLARRRPTTAPPHVAQQVLCYTLQQGVCSMTMLSISAAARAAGVSRTTLQRVESTEVV